MTGHPSSSPLVTLGVPVHNGERYLPEMLNSLRSQDHENLDIVISDNGSTDATPDICAAAAARDARIRYLSQPEDRGRTWNFNHVIDQARGEYFKFAAAEDVLLPTFVSACVAALEASGPRCVLAFPRTRPIDEDSRALEDLDDAHLHIDQVQPHARIARLLQARAFRTVHGLMRTDVVRSTRGIRPVVGDDIVLLIEMAARGGFTLVPEQLFLQRRRGEQPSVRGPGRAEGDDPGRATRSPFPPTALDRECYRAVLTSPLSAAEKARCAAAVTRPWVLPGHRGTGPLLR